MSFELGGVVRLRTSFDYEKSTDISSTSQQPGIDYTVTFSDGSGDNQVQHSYTITTELPAHTEILYDLYNGVENVFGDVLQYDTVKLVQLYNKSTTDSIYMGGSSAGITEFIESSDASANGLVVVNPGGCVAIAAPTTGYTVTATTADILRVHNPSSNSVTYDLLVVGTGTVA